MSGVKITEAPQGLTVAGLKAALAHWPDTDADGEPLEVWVGGPDNLSNVVVSIWPLNKREHDGVVTADLLLGHA